MGFLTGKSAIVTGSTSGIGLDMVRALAAEGADVMINGFGDAAEIETLRAEIEATHGIRALYDGADMSKPDAVTAMVRNAEETFGRVDILVNNAGIQHVAPIEDFPDDRFEAVIAINMMSNWYAIKAALPGMKERNWGRIINLCSAHGLVASPYKSAYVMAKHGVMGLTKSIALEVAETDITVNAINPGYVLTPLVENQIDDQAKAHSLPRDEVVRNVILASQPNKKFVKTADLGALAVFLCSDAAASITGVPISVDGGWTAR